MAYTEDMMFDPMNEQVTDPEAVVTSNSSWNAPDVPTNWQDANPYQGLQEVTYGQGFESDMGGMGEMGGMDMGEEMPMDEMGGMGGMDKMMSQGQMMSENKEPSSGEAANMRDAMISRMNEDASSDDEYQQKMLEGSRRERKMGKM